MPRSLPVFASPRQSPPTLLRPLITFPALKTQLSSGVTWLLPHVRQGPVLKVHMDDWVREQTSD